MSTTPQKLWENLKQIALDTTNKTEAEVDAKAVEEIVAFMGASYQLGRNHEKAKQIKQSKEVA